MFTCTLVREQVWAWLSKRTIHVTFWKDVQEWLALNSEDDEVQFSCFKKYKKKEELKIISWNKLLIGGDKRQVVVEVALCTA